MQGTGGGADEEALHHPHLSESESGSTYIHIRIITEGTVRVTKCLVTQMGGLGTAHGAGWPEQPCRRRLDVD